MTSREKPLLSCPYCPLQYNEINDFSRNQLINHIEQDHKDEDIVKTLVMLISKEREKKE